MEIHKVDDIDDYKYKIIKDKYSLYLLDSKYMSNANIKKDYNNDSYFTLVDGQYTSHEFTNSWSGGEESRYLDFLKNV